MGPSRTERSRPIGRGSTRRRFHSRSQTTLPRSTCSSSKTAVTRVMSWRQGQLQSLSAARSLGCALGHRHVYGVEVGADGGFDLLLIGPRRAHRRRGDLLAAGDAGADRRQGGRLARTSRTACRRHRKKGQQNATHRPAAKSLAAAPARLRHGRNLGRAGKQRQSPDGGVDTVGGAGRINNHMRHRTAQPPRLMACPQPPAGPAARPDQGSGLVPPPPGRRRRAAGGGGRRTFSPLIWHPNQTP